MAAQPVRVTLPEPTQLHGLTSVTLLAGVIDSDAQEMFGWGYCHLLACALVEHTGWRPAVVEQWMPGATAWTWCHAAVVPTQHPGSLLDIYGLRPASAVLSMVGQYSGTPCRVRVLDTVGELHTVFGLPPDTPSTWWRGQAGHSAVWLVRTYVDTLIGQVPNTPEGV